MSRSLKVKPEYIDIVKKAVKRNGYATQQLLAEDLGMSRATIIEFLNGRSVSVLNFSEICRKLALDVQEIADWGDEDDDRAEESVEADSSLYIDRPPIERICYTTVREPGSLLRIKGAKGMGKTMLVDKILADLDKNKYKIVRLSFLQADQAIVSDLDKLGQWFCSVVSRQLGLPSEVPERWETILGKINCSFYFQEYLFPKLKNPLILALEDVDRLFSNKSIADEFLSLFRAWHEEGGTWKKLPVIFAYSTEEYIPGNIHHSPLNVGIEILLPDFTREQVRELANRYDTNWGENEIESIIDKVGGHPYLVGKAIHALTQRQLSLVDFERTAATEEGIYRDHLRGQLLNLQQYPELVEEMRKVLDSNSAVTLNSTRSNQLYGLGLVRFEGNAVKPRYRLYADYFRDRLPPVTP